MLEEERGLGGRGYLILTCYFDFCLIAYSSFDFELFCPINELVIIEDDREYKVGIYLKKVKKAVETAVAPRTR